MVMEADLFVQTSSTATSTGNTTTESVVQLPRVPSSPVITGNGASLLNFINPVSFLSAFFVRAVNNCTNLSFISS